MSHRALRAFFALVALVLTVALVSPAFADGLRVKELNFEEDVVLGELSAPDHMKTKAVVNDDLSSLIRARADFIDELRKTVEDL